MRYVMIEKIAEEIAYDNGCVNANQPLEKVIDKLYLVLTDYTDDFLDSVEAYLSTLDQQEMVRLACGTQEQMDAFSSEFADIYGYEGLNEFLDELFNEAM